MALGDSGVTVTTLRNGALAAICQAFPALDRFPDDELKSAIAQAEALVSRELGIRWVITRFMPYFGADAVPDTSGATEPTEYEPAMDWPGRIPGDGFIRIKTRVRPIREVLSINLNIPGAVVSNFPIPKDWMRVDRTTHEILLAPAGGSALYALAFGQGAMNFRMPGATQVDYRAGLTPDDLAPGGDWAEVRRLVQITALIQVFPMMSLWANPGGLTSESADGLSQSRSSGYVFRDMEERFKEEAETLKNRILGIVEGPGLFFL